ncbi:MAG: threonine synthase [Ignavibacteriales bacterium]|nr:threonine synthase [Ignavibacteriales bacterium]
MSTSLIPFIYKCTECGREYERDAVTYLCPVCSASYKPGIPLCGVLQVNFDYDQLAHRFTVAEPDWNLFTPVEREFFPPYAVGNTPFISVERLGREIDLPNLWVKNDGLNPSGSLKDRASFLLVAEAIRLKEETIVTASTGNAASALAAVCAAAGKKATIYVPESAPKAKLVQMRLYGADVRPVKGTYDDAFALSLEHTAKHGGLNRNTAYHPLTIEGKKTAGLEIYAQNAGSVPDAIVIPVGDGVILSGIYKAFVDLKKAGVTQKLPRLICVQAERSDAIHRYVQTGVYSDAKDARTVADSISVTTPSNAHMARRAIIETDGCSITVTDREIMEAQALLARTTGIFAEPAAAASLAGAIRTRRLKLLKEQEQVVLLITGHGLKDVDAAFRFLTKEI